MSQTGRDQDLVLKLSQDFEILKCASFAKVQNVDSRVCAWNGRAVGIYYMGTNGTCHKYHCHPEPTVELQSAMFAPRNLNVPPERINTKSARLWQYFAALIPLALDEAVLLRKVKIRPQNCCFFRLASWGSMIVKWG
ncbi:hypothetical protein IFM89_014165 [Coptis chinensis]|uniref:Uncharacterized protein n=1 Tax=Coptis chinensis TaxID=261450 RepID=A0A835M2H3_9MAGN|nr:hypothetical protein IFM89_014165 [Coptis chinensis]